MNKLKQFVRHHKIAVGAIVLSAGIALWFCGNVLMDVVYFNDPRHQEQDLKSWMTPRYVVKSYGLPRSVVKELFDLEDSNGKHKKLRFIAEDMGLTLEELTVRVRQAALDYRENSQ